MIVGIDASRANERERSGTEWYAFHMINELKTMAPNDVEFVLYSKTPLRSDLAQLPKGFRSRVLRWPPKLLWTQLRLSWEMLIHPPDVLFVPAHTIPFIRPRRTITTLHDIGFEKFPILYSKKKIGTRGFLKYILDALIRISSLGKYGASELDYHRFSARFALKHAQTVIAVSEFTKHEIEKTYSDIHADLTVIHNGYDKNVYHVIDDTAKITSVLQKYGLNRPFFLTIGRLEEKKNTKGIIEAFATFKRIAKDHDKHQLVLVGNPGYNYSEVEETMRRNDIAHDVHEIGWVAQEELPYLLNAATCFLLPSLYEGFGIPIIEAMACGTPVITSNVASMPEVAGNAAILVDPKRPDAIAHAMQTLAEDSALRAAYREKGFQRIQLFSWRKCAEQTLQLFA